MATENIPTVDVVSESPTATIKDRRLPALRVALIISGGMGFASVALLVLSKSATDLEVCDNPRCFFSHRVEAFMVNYYLLSLSMNSLATINGLLLMVAIKMGTTSRNEPNSLERKWGRKFKWITWTWAGTFVTAILMEFGVFAGYLLVMTHKSAWIEVVIFTGGLTTVAIYLCSLGLKLALTIVKDEPQISQVPLASIPQAST